MVDKLIWLFSAVGFVLSVSCHSGPACAGVAAGALASSPGGEEGVNPVPMALNRADIPPEVVFDPTAPDTAYDYSSNTGRDRTRMSNYDPTNGVSTADAKKPPFGRVLNLVRDENSTLPARIIFEGREAPDSETRNSQPKQWRHEITDRGEIQKVMNALASARLRHDAEWWDAPRGQLACIYRLTLDFRQRDDCAYPMIESITLNLSSMIGNGFNFVPLEKALAKYPPGFKAQGHALLQ